MINFLFLDLDDTILDFEKAEEKAIAKAFVDFGIEPTESEIERYKKINLLQWERYERGEITREEVLTVRFDIFFEKYGLHIDGEYADSVYRHYLGIGHFFVDGAEELLEELKKRRMRLFIASNGVAATQDSRLDSAGIRPYFERIFISETTGFHKPEKEYFDYCFDHIPFFRREEAMIVGDSLTSDILGGIRAGIKTCWFNPKNKPPRADIVPDFEIKTLSEIPELLQK
ncbi:MAG: YjjG family noncanonical pyrimidine nucleotidase [Clostridia bacterium]|nr:YjjG family noncanonical pyrimidine nucleotidase [Clostridia bacterium]